MGREKAKNVANTQQRQGKLFGAKCTYPNCNKVINSPYYMKSHIEKVHQAVVKYPCPFCDFFGDGPEQLEDHMRTHMGANSSFQGEQRDGAMDQEQSSLSQQLEKQEVETVAMGEQTVGPSSRFTVKNKGSLNRTNSKSLQASMKMFRCKVCDFSSDPAELKAHMETHSQERPFSCDLCLYRSNRAANLTSHVRTHSANKSCKCDLCNFRGSYKKDIQLHKILCHEADAQPKRKAPNFQGRSSKAKTGLKARVLVESVPGKRTAFKCSKCSREFPSKFHVSMRVHSVKEWRNKLRKSKPPTAEMTGPTVNKVVPPKGQNNSELRNFNAPQDQKPNIHREKMHFPSNKLCCSECNLKLGNNSKLRKHMLVHSLKRKYPCPFCTYRQRTESELQKHCTLMHKDSVNLKFNSNRGTAGRKSTALLKTEWEQKEKQLIIKFKCRPCYVSLTRQRIVDCS